MHQPGSINHCTISQSIDLAIMWLTRFYHYIINISSNEIHQYITNLSNNLLLSLQYAAWGYNSLILIDISTIYQLTYQSIYHQSISQPGNMLHYVIKFHINPCDWPDSIIISSIYQEIYINQYIINLSISLSINQYIINQSVNLSICCLRNYNEYLYHQSIN